MNITIFPKSPDSKGFVRLHMFVSINNQVGWFPTKIKVLQESWNQQRQSINAKQLDHKNLNGKLAERKGQLISVFKDLDYEKIQPTVEIVRHRYNRILNNTPKKKSGQEIQFLDYFDIYIEERRKIRSEKGYLRKFNPVKEWLIKFNPEIQFKDITHQFYNDFITYVIEEGNLMGNTYSGYIKKIKSIMAAAVIDPRTRNQEIPIDFKMFEDPYVDPKPFWLDWETEIAALESFEPLSEEKIYLEEFLFRCYTGLRHSDVFNLKPENIIHSRGNYYLDFMSIKTRVDQNLQLNPKAVSIIKKWKFKSPKLYQSDCNAVIKKICSAGKLPMFKTTVEKVRYRGNERIVSIIPKWEMVTTHTARRSFGRRWMEKGGTLSKLSVYFGHSSEKITSKYVGWTTHEVNNEMMSVMG